MQTRAATLADIPAILELAVESVSRDPLPVRISREHMAETARGLIGRPNHFVRVVEINGVVVGCVAAATAPGFWFERLQCSVLLYWSLHVGGGIRLLRELAEWVKSRPNIKLCVMELEPGADPRLIRFMKRLGFSRESTNLTYVRMR